LPRVELPKTYDPSQVEERLYRCWEEGQFFHARVNPDRKPFTIVIPPPNVTGSLHAGHALDNTIQDVLIRWRRMQGYETLWLPGMDHAGIATQARVEQALAEEGTNRHEIGRGAFLERAWEWKERYGGRILKQLRRLGASCDWPRQRFTLDEGFSRAVREVFVRLYNKGLIYQSDYIINWCPECHTALSDIEVEHVETAGKLYYVNYPLVDGEGQITIATTRPETILGDTAVAVHPEDERYKHLIGKQVVLPILGRVIPIIADQYVDPAFGTGAVKITPAHDPNDFEVAVRHQLQHIQVIDENAQMTAAAGPYQGMDRYECRRRLVADLQAEGLLIKIAEHGHAVGHCYRCDQVVEPLVSRQWFVKMKPLAAPAIAAVQEGQIRFVPERFAKVYLNWLENVRDWCISRQLWWGHRIPAWYCSCGEVIVSMDTPAACPKCGGGELRQDPDVLDTWFSSALWPFATMGWPEKTPELDYFYPTSVLVTGYDIIFFWVARMVFSSLEHVGQIPFYDVLIHGIVRDDQGRKMSKSLGNGIDPLEVIEEYGADALRFTLITGNSPGNDMRFSWERVAASRNFANKIWNAARFALMHLDGFQPGVGLEGDLPLEDRWIRSRLDATTAEVTRLLGMYELGEAARVLYDFIWSEFCDWYIELVKGRLNGTDPASRQKGQATLYVVLKTTMRLLHPFMPFITEEIWQHLPVPGETITIAPWPTPSTPRDQEAEAEMHLIMEAVRAIRNARAEMGVDPGRWADAVAFASPDVYPLVQAQAHHLRQMARLGTLEIRREGDRPARAITAVVAGLEVCLPLEGLIDIEREIRRLRKERDALRSEVAKAQAKLANEQFLARAPAAVVAKERERGQELQEHLQALSRRLQMLGGE
jgi:valyl-tRNA synthetase